MSVPSSNTTVTTEAGASVHADEKGTSASVDGKVHAEGKTGPVDWKADAGAGASVGPEGAKAHAEVSGHADAKVGNTTVSGDAKAGVTADSKEGVKASAKATGPLAGVSVDNLTPEKAREYRLPTGTTGVVITDVDPGSDAAIAGLRPGVVILEVSRQPVASVNEFNAALAKLGGKKSVFLRVRDGSGVSVVLVQPQE